MRTARGNRTLVRSTSGMSIHPIASVALAAALVHQALSSQLRLVVTVDTISRASASTFQSLRSTHEGALRKRPVVVVRRRSRPLDVLAVSSMWFRPSGNVMLPGADLLFSLVGQERRRILRKFTSLTKPTGKVLNSALDLLSLVSIRRL